MICPRCGAEYRPGYVDCDQCGVPLVSGLFTPPEKTPVEIETVFASSSTGRVALAKSLLMAQGIDFAVRGECAPLSQFSHPGRNNHGNGKVCGAA